MCRRPSATTTAVTAQEREHRGERQGRGGRGDHEVRWRQSRRRGGQERVCQGQRGHERAGLSPQHHPERHIRTGRETHISLRQRGSKKTSEKLIRALIIGVN